MTAWSAASTSAMANTPTRATAKSRPASPSPPPRPPEVKAGLGAGARPLGRAPAFWSDHRRAPEPGHPPDGAQRDGPTLAGIHPPALGEALEPGRARTGRP